MCKPDAGTGRHAVAVHRRIMSSCAGRKRRPTAEDFYEAVRATRPMVRRQAIVDMWGREATFQELLDTWAQRAYTDRQLVPALHLADFNWRLWRIRWEAPWSGPTLGQTFSRSDVI